MSTIGIYMNRARVRAWLATTDFSEEMRLRIFRAFPEALAEEMRPLAPGRFLYAMYQLGGEADARPDDVMADTIEEALDLMPALEAAWKRVAAKEWTAVPLPPAADYDEDD